MSRNLKRVPLLFSWPRNEVWEGYLNPHAERAAKCPDCENGYDRAGGRPDANAALFYAQWYGDASFDPTAYGAVPILPDDPVIWDLARRNVDHSPNFHMTYNFPSFDREGAVWREAQRLHKECFRRHWCHHLIQADVDALISAGRLWNFTRQPRDAGQALVVAVRMALHNTNSWLPEPNGHHPTAAEVNTWSRGRGLGHDTLNAGICVEARCTREGVPSTCVRCGGTGEVWPTDNAKRLHDEWQKLEPPIGDGYQLWENCSEGSPISPVFGSLDALCAWAEVNATTFADFRATKEEWRERLDGGVVHAKAGGHNFL